MKKEKIFAMLGWMSVALLILTGNIAAQEQLNDEDILKLYAGLRVADVSDGMDMVGLRDLGLMGTEIEALWKNIDDLSHIFCGVAVTARYIPTNKVIKNPMDPDEFRAWEGAALVLDVQGDGDTGSVGSNNGLMWVSKGCVGIVSNGGIRDTDEVIKQKIPVYLDHKNRGRGIRPGRNEIESVNKPVSVGGVLVTPGDIVVADGDGVVVVPREYAQKVAEYARGILNSDKKSRRSLYEQLGIPMDKTVEID
jgi:regulator of RNase E activity RraA